MSINPVEQRLVGLRERWDEFCANPHKRLLLWQVPDNALRTLQCFFEAQKHETETEYSTDDLFIVFNSPFINSIQYSRALKEELLGQYDASREDLEKESIKADWAFEPAAFPDSATGFIRSLRSFGSAHHKIIGHLAAVLMPQTIDNDTAFASWLTRAMAAGLPERLRLVVVDSTEHPRLNQLAESGNEVVHVESPKIDVLTVAQETFAQEKTVGPAGVFRNHLMGLVTLIEKGPLDQVKAKAADAFAFVRKQNWADQEVAVRMLFAGALLKHKRFEEAVKVYQGARQSAQQAVKLGHPTGQQLILQTWFGEAGTHLAAGDTKQAAGCYDQAGAVAEQIPNLILAIEAYRMGVFCHGRLDQREAALERGAKLFECARRLKPEARGMTTMPLAAIDFLRIVDPHRLSLLEDIKYRHDLRVEEANQELERQAREFDDTDDPHRLLLAEKKLSSETAQAAKEADEALDEAVRSGSNDFQGIFFQARGLLDERWPFSALTVVPLPSEAKGEKVLVPS